MALNVILSGKVNHLFIYIFYKELIGMNISKSYVGILFSYCEVISVNTKLWLTFNVFLYERFNYLYFSQVNNEVCGMNILNNYVIIFFLPDY